MYPPRERHFEVIIIKIVNINFTFKPQYENRRITDIENKNVDNPMREENLYFSTFQILKALC